MVSSRLCRGTDSRSGYKVLGFILERCFVGGVGVFKGLVVVVREGWLYIKLLVKDGRYISKSCFLENQPNQVGIKLVNWSFSLTNW